MLLGFIAGLTFSIGFVIGFKAKERYERTGGFLVTPKPNEPVWHSPEDERALEDRMAAGA
jgi:hypothetical protein